MVNEDLKVHYYKQGGRWQVDIVYDEHALGLDLAEATQVTQQLLEALKKINSMEE